MLGCFLAPTNAFPNSLKSNKIKNWLDTKITLSKQDQKHKKGKTLDHKQREKNVSETQSGKNIILET